MVRQYRKKLKGEPVILSPKQLRAVDEAIHEVCEHRRWKLYAINVRTNHVHAVVSAVASSDKVLNDFKAYATRKLRENKSWAEKYSPWVDKGSKRNLWNADHYLQRVRICNKWSRMRVA